jgi:hypothetical protein
MNYEQFNILYDGQKVICNQDHHEFKKGDVATVKFQYYGERMYYRWAITKDGRTDLLDAFHKYWEEEQ